MFFAKYLYDVETKIVMMRPALMVFFRFPNASKIVTLENIYLPLKKQDGFWSKKKIAN